MYKIYLLTLLRRILKNPVSSTIEILGIAVGLACITLTILYADEELGYDAFWQDADNIYRIETTLSSDGRALDLEYQNTYPTVVPLILQYSDVVQNSARITQREFIANYNRVRNYENVYFADPSFLKVFNIGFIKGDPNTALESIHTVVITQSTAEEYFGSENPIHKTITLDVKRQLTVTGVIEDFPHNSHLKVKFISSLNTLVKMYPDIEPDRWRGPLFYSYVKVLDGIDKDTLQYALQHLVEEVQSNPDIAGRLKLYAVPIKKIHLSASASGPVNEVGVLYLISAVVLLVACFNSINMTTARSLEKRTEIGIRKVSGASKLNFLEQWLFEGFIVALFALILSVAIVEAAIPLLNALTDKNLKYSVFFDLTVGARLLAVCVMVSIVANLYPAALIAIAKPVDIIKNNTSGLVGSLALRRLLVITQFSVAVSLGIITFVFYSQARYLNDLDLGFDKEELVLVSNMNWTDIRPKYNIIKNEIAGKEGVLSVTGSLTVPGAEMDRLGTFLVEGAPESQEKNVLNIFTSDFDFFNTYRIPMLAGRDFSTGRGEDEFTLSNNFEGGQDRFPLFSTIINRAAVEKLGFPSAEAAVGRTIKPTVKGWNFSLRIIGVVNNFHINAGHDQIRPYLFLVNPKSIIFMSIKVDKNKLGVAMRNINTVWKRVLPDYPIVKSFLADNLNERFREIQNYNRVLSLLTFIAIFLSCISCFCLSSYLSKRRIKEISIRKVLGASKTSLMCLMASELYLVGVSNAISFPIAYAITRVWLNGFAYRIDLSIFIFLFIGVISLALALAAVGYHAVKVAGTSPTEVLRCN